LKKSDSRGARHDLSAAVVFHNNRNEEAMTPRPPSEVSAANFIDNLERERNKAIADLSEAKRQIRHFEEVRDARDRALFKAQEAWRCFHCNEVFTDRDAAAAHFGERDDPEWPSCIKRAEKAERELSSARLALIPLQVDKAAAEKMAIDTGRELAEARKALEKAEGEREAAYARNRVEVGIVFEYHRRAREAESSLREHTEAIIAVFNVLRFYAGGGHYEQMQGSLEFAVTEDGAKARAALAAPIPTLASRLSAEREKERAALQGALAALRTANGAIQQKRNGRLMAQHEVAADDALHAQIGAAIQAILAASPSDKEDT